MKISKKIKRLHAFVISTIAFALLLHSLPVQAADEFECTPGEIVMTFCNGFSNSKTDCEKNNTVCAYDSNASPASKRCSPKDTLKTECAAQTEEKACKDKYKIATYDACVWVKKGTVIGETKSTDATTDNGSSFIPKKPDGYNGPLPDCAFAGTCRNVNDVLELMVNWGQRIFGLIGSFALVMFVYGGFVMIFSAGNAEKVKQGRDILTAAVIGLVIAFSAYLLIDFILDALNVSDEFRGVNL